LHLQQVYLVKISIPIADTPIMLIATQIPVPRKNNKIDIKKIIRNNSDIINYFFSLKSAK